MRGGGEGESEGRSKERRTGGRGKEEDEDGGDKVGEGGMIRRSGRRKGKR